MTCRALAMAASANARAAAPARERRSAMPELGDRRREPDDSRRPGCRTDRRSPPVVSSLASPSGCLVTQLHRQQLAGLRRSPVRAAAGAAGYLNGSHCRALDRRRPAGLDFVQRRHGVAGADLARILSFVVEILVAQQPVLVADQSIAPT